MTFWRALAAIFATVAIFDLGSGLARLTGPERFYRASGVWEEVELRGIDSYLESTPGNERGFTVTLSDKSSEGIGSEWADSTAVILIAVGIFLFLSILGGIIVLKNANFDEE